MNVRFEIISVILLCTAPLFNGSIALAAESREEIEAFLSAPSAVEIFKSTKGQNRQATDNQESPLVRQAQAFALYLDPPPKPQPRSESPDRPQVAELRPAEISAKFELIGTCYYAANPEMSLALIREPTKDRWVRQGSKVGRLVIEKIDDGKATIRDNQRTFELMALRAPKPSLVKSGPGVDTGIANIQVPGLTAAAVESMPEMSAEETALLDKFFAEMEALEANQTGEGPVSQEEAAKGVALMDQLLVELEKARVSTDEANELDNLGEQLQADQQGARELQKVQPSLPQAAPSQKVNTNRLPPPPPRRTRTARPSRTGAR